MSTLLTLVTQTPPGACPNLDVVNVICNTITVIGLAYIGARQHRNGQRA